MVIGLVDETQSLVRVVFSHASAAASGSLACSCLPRKSEEAGSLSAESMPVMAASIV